MSVKLNRYFDNGATSFPKPMEVSSAMAHHLNLVGGTYGRSAYGRVLETTSLVEECRDEMLGILGGDASESVVFSSGATSAVNMLIYGLNLRGKRVLVSPLEHNAVMRTLCGYNISWDVMPHKKDGEIDIEALSKIDISNYSLLIVNHQSNVNGVIQPISRIAELKGDVPLLIDAAQSLGDTPFNASLWGVDYVVFTGHKSLLGPTGVGGYYAKDITNIKPLFFGGTGSNSASFDMPEMYPDRYEPGTPNIINIVGLSAAIKNIPEPLHSRSDFMTLLDNVKSLKHLRVLCADDFEKQGELFSIISERISGADFSYELQEQFGIETRVGLHCAPMAHHTLKSFDTGAIRFSLSKYHTKEDLDYLYYSIKELV